MPDKVSLNGFDKIRRVVFGEFEATDGPARVGSLTPLQAQSAAEFDALLPSVLDRAFKGEL